MDISSFLSTSVPAYFVVAPLLIIVVSLLVVLVKSGKKDAQAPTAMPAPAAQPAQSVAPAAVSTPQQAPAPLPTTPKSEPVTPPIEAATPPQPAPHIVGEIPPISSWKPSEPAVSVPIVEDVAGLQQAPTTALSSDVATTDLQAVTPQEGEAGQAKPTF